MAQLLQAYRHAACLLSITNDVACSLFLGLMQTDSLITVVSYIRPVEKRHAYVRLSRKVSPKISSKDGVVDPREPMPDGQ